MNNTGRPDVRTDRRTFLRLTLAPAAVAFSASCGRDTDSPDVGPESHDVAIAAAANLIYAAEALNAEFRRTTPGARLTLTTGASGSLFAQIQHGAPLDVFLSADADYPARLAASGAAEASTLRTFARGRLVLWTTRSDVDVTDVRRALEDPRVQKIAIAQPQTAPYGRAAEAVLKELGLRERTRRKIVVGENIAQTAQFVETGSADVGFVALSLVHSSHLARKGRWQEVPASLYANVPLDHAVVLTRRGAGKETARLYLDFLRSNEAHAVLRRFGYEVP